MPRLLCSRRCAVLHSQLIQSQLPSPLPAYQKPWLHIEQRSLWATCQLVSGPWSVVRGQWWLSGLWSLAFGLSSFILGHYFLTTLEDLAHHSLLWHRKYLQTICASLLQLLALDLRHLREVFFGPFVFHKFQRIILSEWMAFPV